GIDDISPANTVERHAAGVKYAAPDGTNWLIGATAWLAQHDVQGIETGTAFSVGDREAAPGATVHMARDGKWEGRIELQDCIRDDSLTALDALRNQGCRTLLVTGDRQAAASQVG